MCPKSLLYIFFGAKSSHRSKNIYTGPFFPPGSGSTNLLAFGKRYCYKYWDVQNCTRKYLPFPQNYGRPPHNRYVYLNDRERKKSVLLALAFFLSSAYYYYYCMWTHLPLPQKISPFFSFPQNWRRLVWPGPQKTRENACCVACGKKKNRHSDTCFFLVRVCGSWYVYPGKIMSVLHERRCRN